MNAKGNISNKENKTKITTATLMQLAGLSAMLAGVCLLVIGLFHPVNIPSSVTTDAWLIVHYFATALGFFGLFGMAGLYARQAEKAGWLGLAGFILFTAWMTLVSGFSFLEAFIHPILATESPVLLKDLLGMFSSVPSEINLGVLPTLWNISGFMYILGPLLFGIATVRAGVLPRWAGGLLALGALLVPVGVVVPPEYQPKIMIPIGLAFLWLGFALLSERRAKSPETMLSQAAIKPVASKVA